MGKHRLRTLCCVLGVMALLPLHATAQQHPANDFLLPETEPDDTFYRVSPKEISRTEHGHLIRYRPANPTAGLEHAERSELLIYQSAKNDGKDTARAVSGIVAIPKGTPPAGGWPIISWAHGTVGSADKCAPSMDSDALADINDPTNPPLTVHRKINRAPHTMLNAFLDAGWAVVMTDYEGLGTAGWHPYLNGPSEARGVLDMVRAAHQFGAKEGIKFSNKFAIVGHSQGGHAALFAASLQKEWVPEFDLVGVTAIAPASSPDKLQGLPAATLLPIPPKEKEKIRQALPFLPLAIVGAQRGNPDINLDAIFTEKGLALFKKTIDSECRTELSQTDNWAQPLGGYFKAASNPFPPSWPDLDAQLKKMHPNLRIAAPIRISQADGDTRVQPSGTRELVGQLNDKNQSNPNPPAVFYVEYRQGEVAKPDPESLGEHFGILKTDVAPMVDWLRAKFCAGEPKDCQGVHTTHSE